MSSATLVVLAPVLALCWGAVKLDDPRSPAVESLPRIGLDGREFTLLNFRSSPEGRLLSLLASYGLLHLPELVNVLRGDMSVVGPRPLPVGAEDTGSTVDGSTTRRAGVRPGMTGLWTMVDATELTPEHVASLERKYVASWSLLLDIRIMIDTAAAVRNGGKRPGDQ